MKMLCAIVTQEEMVISYQGRNYHFFPGDECPWWFHGKKMKRYRNLSIAVAYIDSYRNKDFPHMVSSLEWSHPLNHLCVNNSIYEELLAIFIFGNNDYREHTIISCPNTWHFKQHFMLSKFRDWSQRYGNFFLIFIFSFFG